MIAKLFFALLAGGMTAEVLTRTRFEKALSFMLLCFLALWGVWIFESESLDLVNKFSFHWIDASLMRVNINLNTSPEICRLVFALLIISALSVFYNTFYKAETEGLRLNGLLTLNLAMLVSIICSQNFIQLLTAVCITDVLCLLMINDIESKRRYAFYNLLADMGLFTLFALIWKQTGSIDLAVLGKYHRLGQYPELTSGLLLLCVFIKSGIFLCHGGLLSLASLTFNRILAISYCSAPIVGILLLIKTYPLLENIRYMKEIFLGFGGATLLWGFVGSLVLDNIKDKALYFNQMIYAFMLGALALGTKDVDELLPLVLALGFVLNAVWMLTTISASNELFVSNMGGFIRPLKLLFATILVLGFVFVQILGSRITAQNELWMYSFVAIFLVALAHIAFQIFLGKSNADERVLAFLKNPPLLNLLPLWAMCGIIIWQQEKPTAQIWIIWGAFLVFLFSGPLRTLGKAYDSENLQEADWLHDFYQVVLIAPIKILGRVLWLLIDFLIIERTIVSSLTSGSNLLVRVLDRMHTGSVFSNAGYVFLGLGLFAAIIYAKVYN